MILKRVWDTREILFSRMEKGTMQPGMVAFTKLSMKSAHCPRTFHVYEPGTLRMALSFPSTASFQYTGIYMRLSRIFSGGATMISTKTVAGLRA